ncbi:amidohydrolase/deacetylase family metallohydrolase [Pararhizobium mangrovi]|uniref:Amidohydrolase/deacetylase family metallohydrolase n=1 Tax=Pararhizobium mangrovi TaxID=2590452 RepID=A0A506UB37_9HYPH|nr:amidohydrolase/deacetylase family metallohydrolase [Pararhizobium mangrovi]
MVLTNVSPIGFDGGTETGEICIDGAGRIAAEAPEAARVIDCGGAYVSPGWADLHVHVWHGGTDISIRADEAGVSGGVTAMADAGSAGEASFHGLREYVIEKQRETVRAFLNIGSIGLVACNRVSELIDMRSIDVDRTLAVIEANRDVICGIKVRASGVIVGAWGITPVKIAKRVAEIAELPLMVHIGEPPPMIDEVLDILTPGDVVTHCFNGKKSGSIADTPQLMEMAKQLAASGVRMDIGHGAASYSFAVAERAIADGLKPFSISTDLHRRNVHGPVYDLATTVSKVHAAGLGFEDCVEAICGAPRGFLGLPARNGLEIGEKADLTVFDLVDADEVVTDSLGHTLRVKRFFEPRFAVIGDEAFEAARAGRKAGAV